MKPSVIKAAGTLCLLVILGSIVTGSRPDGHQSIISSQQITAGPPFTVTAAFWGTISPPVVVGGVIIVPPQITPVEAGPGQQNVPLTVTLLYNANASERVVSLNSTLTLPTGFTSTTGLSVASASQYALPAPPITFSLTYYLDVASSTPLGTFGFPMNVTWYTTTNSTITHAQLPSISLKLAGMVKLNFSATQTELNAGQTNNLTLNLSNNGTGAASQISITPIASPTTSILNALPRVSSLSPSASTQMHLLLYVPVAQTGSAVTLSLTSSYTDAYGNSRVATQSLGFFVNTTSTTQFTSPISISVQPSTLIAGEVTSLAVLISNTGSTNLTTLTASFSFPIATQATWLSPDIARQTRLTPSQTMPVSASVYEPPNGLSSAVVLQVVLTYYDSFGNFRQEARSIGLLSRGIVSLQPTDTAITPLQPNPGEVFSITVTLTNTGTIIASSVMANVTSLPGAFTLFGSGSVFLGDMPTSSPTPFTITFTVSNDTDPGTYRIPIQLTYRDNLRNNMTSTLQVPITVVAATTGTTSGTGPERGFGLVILLGTTIVVAAIMFGAGLTIGRRRTGKK